jgi:hypothetical protein
MTRLEFQSLENKEELKEVLNALAKGLDYFKPYTDKEGKSQTKLLCRNGRLYVGSNYSISLSIDEKTQKCYLGVDYLSSDDRIKLNNNKPSTTDVF